MPDALDIFLFNSMMLSEMVVFDVLTVVVLPVTFKSPAIVTDPATSSDVPFSSFNSSLFNLNAITFDPAFLTLNSIAPSSVPSDASSIFPDIVPYWTS